MIIKNILLKDVGRFNKFELKNLKRQLYSIESIGTKSNGVGKTTIIRAMAYGISNTFPDTTINKESIIKENAKKAEIHIEFDSPIKIINRRFRINPPVKYDIYEGDKKVNIKKIPDKMEYVQNKYGFVDVARYCYYRKFTELPPAERLLLLTDAFLKIDFDKIYLTLQKEKDTLQKEINELEKQEHLYNKFKNELKEKQEQLNNIQKQLIPPDKETPYKDIQREIKKIVLYTIENNLKTCPVCENDINISILNQKMNFFEKYKEYYQALEKIKSLENEIKILTQHNQPIDLKKLNDLRISLQAIELFKDYFILPTSKFRRELVLNILNVFNALVNDFLSKFLDFPIELLSDMSINTVKILSKGESHVYNMAIFLTLLRLYKQKNPLPDVLFIDEFIDVLDNENVNKMLSLFLDLSNEYQIFLTTPKPLPLTENNKILIDGF